MSKPKFYLRIRSYPNAFPQGGFVSCWLLRIDGSASYSLLFGDITPAAAEELALTLGLPVERDECEVWQPGEIRPIREKQAGLFDGEGQS